MRPLITTFFIAIFISSCIREEIHNSKTYICNTSSKKIKIEFYRYGIVQKIETVDSIIPNECKIVKESNDFGKTTAQNYLDNILYMDSALITFEDGIKLVHYGYFQKIGPNPKAFPSNHPRNIFTDGNGYKDNWVYNVLKETKRSKTEETRYTFREQDYIDAQK